MYNRSLGLVTLAVFELLEVQGFNPPTVFPTPLTYYQIMYTYNLHEKFIPGNFSQFKY